MLCSCVIFVPVDVIKERLQVQHIQHKEMLTATASSPLSSKVFTPYLNSWDACQHILRNEGWIKGIYRGYGITLFSFGPFSALYFLLYEKVCVMCILYCKLNIHIIYTHIIYIHR